MCFAVIARSQRVRRFAPTRWLAIDGDVAVGKLISGCPLSVAKKEGMAA
jgi:hypothetical protein